MLKEQQQINVCSRNPSFPFENKNQTHIHLNVNSFT